MSGNFLSTAQFAALIGLHHRAARLALQSGTENRTWRGVHLQVRVVPSRGGSHGFAYEVALDSIPARFLERSNPPLSDLSKAAEDAITGSPKPVPQEPAKASAPVLLASNLPPRLKPRICGGSQQAEWRFSIIQPIQQTTKPHSAERAARIAEVAAARKTDWRGRPCIVAERSIRRWITRYEAKGFAGLMRKAPKNAGERRVHLSRAWDHAMRAAGLSEAAIADLTAQARKRVRGEWAAGTPSWPTVQLNSRPFVIGITLQAGIRLPDVELNQLCTVPRRFVEAERQYAIVAVKHQDAARYAAEMMPRIRRDRSQLRPGDWVAADVHHLDVLFRCPDGREVTPKAVAWMDLATNRTWIDFFIMPKGEMIRREHVIQSFVSMCSNPNWGVPSHLYMDNGGEYNWSEIATDLSKLKHSIDLHFDENPDDAALGSHRARPYNPQGKVIEGLFSNLERVAFAQLPGWIGGDRMRKKTANQGRAPQPYPGDEAQLRKALDTALAYYHAKPQAGHLANVSPNDRFAKFVGEGWTATVLDPWELAVAFSREMVKPVRTGGTLRLDNMDFRANELLSLVGHKVLVRQPMFGDRETLFVFTEDGEPLAIARPDVAYAFADSAGAEEQGRRAKALADEVKTLETEAQPAAAGGERAMADVVASLGSAPMAQPPGAVIRLNPHFSEAAQMAKDAPAREEEAFDRKRNLVRTQFAVLEQMDRMAKAG